jgi:hypothetical protein
MDESLNPARRRLLRRWLWASGLLLAGVLPAGFWAWRGLSESAGTKWALLPPRPIGWRMKDISSATVAERTLPGGRVVLHIEHELLAGVTPEMLVWWWRNIEGDVTLDGLAYRRYLIWHPLDHIHFSLLQRAADGTVGPGAVFHVVEALGADMRHLVDVALHLRELDESGATVEVQGLGRPVMRMRGEFIARPGGTQFISTMTIGSAGRLASLGLNGWLLDRFFPAERRQRWLRHSVEEIGNLQFFLPELYRRRGETRSAAAQRLRDR